MCALDTEFTGVEELRRIKAEGPAQKLVAFVMQDPGIPSQGMGIEEGGEVTSGSHSPMLDRGIGMGYVAAEHTEPGTTLTIDVRGTAAPRRSGQETDLQEGGVGCQQPRATRTSSATTPSTTGPGSRATRRPSAITWFAQDSLGELVHFEPPEEGAEVTKGASYGEVESVKAVSDLISPLSGTVLEVNPKVVAEPETVNEDPYGEGWLVRIRLGDASEADDLMDAAAYKTFVDRAVSFLSLTERDRDEMLAAIGVDVDRRALPRHPGGCAIRPRARPRAGAVRAGDRRRTSRSSRRGTSTPAASSRSSAPGSTTTTSRRSSTPSSSAASS